MIQRLWRTLWTDRGLQMTGVVCLLGYLLYLFLFKIHRPWTATHIALSLSVPLSVAYVIVLVLKSQWSRLVGIAYFGFILLVEARLIAQKGLGWGDAFAVAALCYGMWQAWTLDVHEGEEHAEEDQADDEPQPLISLVLLQKVLPHLEAVILARLASQAWGIPVAGNDMEEDNDAKEGKSDAYIVGQPPIFMCCHPVGMFLMNVTDQPYWEEDVIPKVAAEMRDLRAHLAIERHTAWLSLDLVGGVDRDDPTVQQRAYQVIGRFLAAIADENTLAVVDPKDGGLFVYDPETEAKLKSDAPLESLRERFYAPIINVADDDPAMVRAVQEAKDRWPEFVAAFESRSDDAPPFIIKAPFTEGENTECMWVEVTGIEHGRVFGILKNDAARLSDLHEGSRVTVKEADVNDWICVQSNERLGAFTVKVLADKLKERT